MGEEKKKNKVQILLIVIVIVLAIACVLFATKTINLKNDSLDCIADNKTTKKNDGKNKDKNTNNDSIEFNFDHENTFL